MTELEPGPYKTERGDHVVVFRGTTDGDGDIAAHTSLALGDYFWAEPSRLKPLDSWPDWWPFPDTPVPERRGPEPQVGEFWIDTHGDIQQIIHVGSEPADMQALWFNAGRVHVVNGVGINLIGKVDRPKDWPL